MGFHFLHQSLRLIALIDHLEEELEEKLHLGERARRVGDFVRVFGPVLTIFVQLGIQTRPVHETVHDKFFCATLLSHLVR